VSSIILDRMCNQYSTKLQCHVRKCQVRRSDTEGTYTIGPDTQVRIMVHKAKGGSSRSWESTAIEIYEENSENVIEILM
jgi:hypothetical protein